MGLPSHLRLPSHLHIISIYHRISSYIIRYHLCVLVYVYHDVSWCIMWYHVSWYHMIYRDITVCGLGAWAVVGGDDIMWYHSISCRVDDVEYDIWIWRYIIIYHQYIMCRYHVHVSSRTRHDIDMISHGEKKKMISRYIMIRRGTWYIMILEMIHNDISW